MSVKEYGRKRTNDTGKILVWGNVKQEEIEHKIDD